MQQNLKVDSPCTVYVQFAQPLPNLFAITDARTGRNYFFRYLDGRTPRIKFNIPDPGNYTFSVPVKITRIKGIEIPDRLPELPPAERNRYKGEPEVLIDPELDDMARIYTTENTIVLGKRWLELPSWPIQLFILLHEKWHMFYLTEDFCDMGALNDFLRMGYNRSTAYYALDNFLSDTNINRYRVKQLFNNIQKTQKEPLL
jgi:hypothetical protein